MKSFLCCAALVVIHPLAGAAVYVPPQEDGLILRRDQVLLDEGSMRGLASDLAELAAGIAVEQTPQSLRAASQMVALGSFLDSGHKQINALNNELSEKRTPKASDDTALARAKRRIQDVIAWLETEQAGPGGKAFAAYLKDPLAVANDPDAVAMDDSLARWKGIVAPPQAFEDPKQATAAPPDLAEPTTDESPKPSPTPGPAGTAELKLENVAVHAPFLAWDSDEGRFAAVVANVKATVKKNPEAQGFNFRFPTDGLSDYTSLLRAMRRGPQKPLALGAVAAVHGKLPEPVQAQLSVGDHQKYVDDNIEILHGAAAVLMEASLSGIEPRKDVTIIGYPDENGKWRSPRRMWERLKTYEEVSEGGGILVVPSDSVAILEAFLVFEKPEFFMKRQVILAGSFAEVIEIVRSTEDGDGWLAQASEKFSEIQKANPAGTSGLGIYLANRHVRDRLQELRTQAPRHASAALLLVQGSGLRPFKVTRKVAAEELRARMAPVTYASGYNSWEFPDQEALQDMLDRARPAVEEFLPKVSSDERALYEEATAILTSVKALIRYTGLASSSDSQKRNLTTGRDQLRADWTKFRAHLATAAGEPTAEEIAAKEKKEDEEAQKAKEAANSGK